MVEACAWRVDGGGWGMRGRVKDGQAPDLCTLQFEADDRGTLQGGPTYAKSLFWTCQENTRMRLLDAFWSCKGITLHVFPLSAFYSLKPLSSPPSLFIPLILDNVLPSGFTKSRLLRAAISYHSSSTAAPVAISSDKYSRSSQHPCILC